MKGLCDKFPGLANTGDLPQRFLYNMTSSAVKLHLDIALNGGSYRKLAKSYALQGTVASVHGYLAQGIGKVFDDKIIDAVSHKLCHGAIAAVAGKVAGEDPGAAALGAMVAETVADVAYDTQLADLTEETKVREAQMRGESPDGRLTSDQRASLLENYLPQAEKLRTDCAQLGRYAALAAAVLAKQDPNTVFNAAEVALGEDFTQRKVNLDILDAEKP